MHTSSYQNMQYFVEKYLDKNAKLKIIDIGSYDVNGTFKPLFQNPNWEYTGLDMSLGPNVDLVVTDIYNWAIEDQTYDVIVSGSAFEHIEFFWKTMEEIKRILKPNGLCCIIAPSNGPEHRYPVDCWRFFIDGFKALAKYVNLTCLESYVSEEDKVGLVPWKDCVLIAQNQISSNSIIETSLQEASTNQAFSCTCCGSNQFYFKKALWKELVDDWRLSPTEENYIDRQQGIYCKICHNSLRSMALAKAMMRNYHYDGIFKDFIRHFSQLKILEINEAGNLTPFLSRLPHHQLVTYPQTDMMNLPLENNTFDLVIHSDTLEHVKHPIRGLSECQRVLKKGGFCVYTVPVIVDRMTCNREGLKPSYHDMPTDSMYLVHTEYGCDMWTQPMQAGFSEVKITNVEYPSALAITAVK